MRTAANEDAGEDRIARREGVSPKCLSQVMTRSATYPPVQ
jgi:hypothetical protein